MQVFRVTPDTLPEPNLYSMPDYRIRGTGNFRELELSETAKRLMRELGLESVRRGKRWQNRVITKSTKWFERSTISRQKKSR